MDSSPYDLAAVRAAAEGMAQRANRDPMGGDVEWDPADWVDEARWAAPAVLLWAADHLDAQPMFCREHDNSMCTQCPVGSDLLRLAAAEIDGWQVPGAGGWRKPSVTLAATSVLPEHLRGDGPCQDCGTVDNIVWFADNVFWNHVMAKTTAGGQWPSLGDPGGIVCIPCFIRRVAAAGLAPTGWRLLPEWRWTEGRGG